MKEIEELLLIMKSLRDPINGCPWDREQTIDSIKGYSIEEVYELVDAIERANFDDIKDELGDLLFHIIFYSEMADEDKHFNFKEIVEQLNEKLKRRHPHVFADVKLETAEEVKALWETIKQQERTNTKNNQAPKRLLQDIGKHMPAIQTATRLQKRAAGVGFDWNNSEDILKKLTEELEEVRHAVKESDDIQHICEELGDLMFCCINLARHYQIDAETALRSTNDKFIRRFNYIEETLIENKSTLEQATLEEMDLLWDEAKSKLN